MSFACPVVGKIMAPQNIHVLLPRTYECVKLVSKEELKLQMEFRLLIS